VNLRERILSVYAGNTPDVVPYMLDLSHWFYWRHRQPWDLSQAYEEPEYALIDFHRQVGAGFYMPNLAAFHSVTYPDHVEAATHKRLRRTAPEIVWRLRTPSGAIERARVWEEQTYAWGITQWGIRTTADLRVFVEAMSARTFAARWDRFHAWNEYVGDVGVTYVSAGYSAMGHLLNYWMGVEQAAYFAADHPDELLEAVSAVNANNLDLIDLLCDSPARIIIMGDNFSSDTQPPPFFARYSRAYYTEAIRRVHAAGKWVAVHVDGRLHQALGMIGATGADCGDAITPTPMGDLTPDACRAEAGPDLILSGGVSPDLWLPRTPPDAFERAVIDWLAIRHTSPRLIAAAGDQVPPGAAEERIHRMRELVEQHGRY
jgi:hypothetical protein